MADIIEVKQVPWSDKNENLIELTSLDDLQKVAQSYEIPFILKRGKMEYFLFVEALKSVLTYKG